MATRVPRRPSAFAGPLTTTTTSALVPQTQSVLLQTQTRNANILRRPRIPYSFTQLVQLSDGSTYTMRTMSPVGMYKSQKDTRNHLMWNPNEKALQNVEVDEAGRLALFRERFGRDYDAQKPGKATDSGKGDSAFDGDSLGDLMNAYSKSGEDEKEMGGNVKVKGKRMR